VIPWASSDNDVSPAVVASATATPGAGDLESRYLALVARFGPALERLCRAYERASDAREDLRQEILVALWRALPGFEERSSLRTWVYRVAHNVAVTHVTRARAARDVAAGADWQSLDDIADPVALDADLDRRRALERLSELLQHLRPPDKQLFWLYLEGVEQAEIAEITGLAAGNVATKVHRIKALLARQFARHGGAR
jgi:RNA polymerase sigma-70 factor (ECF subfamily)